MQISSGYKVNLPYVAHVSEEEAAHLVPSVSYKIFVEQLSAHVPVFAFLIAHTR